ncbi:MAG: metallophosphoesterase [Oscillospiraceae bacterium]|nr:metallophosphoesterase [Oscillospiraceae bacterium]
MIKKFLKCIIVVVLFVAAILVYSNTYITTSKYTVESAKISRDFDGFKIVHVSDLHSAVFGQDNRRLIKVIDDQEPDIVVLTGDMVNSQDSEFDVFYNFAEQIAKKYPTYFVYGNHELILSEDYRDKIVSTIKSYGIIVLDNQMIEVKKGDSKINVYGMWFNLRFYRDTTNDTTDEYEFTASQMKKILGNCDTDKFNMLLTHNPVYFTAYSEWGADLTLAGHLHGGMIRIPFLGGLFSPEKSMFPEYDSGEFLQDNNSMIVSRGIGNGLQGFRFNNCPVLDIITLKSVKSD